MAKKNVKIPFNTLSDVKCKCGRFLKARIVQLKPTADKCYKCHQEMLRKSGKKYRHFKAPVPKEV